MQLHAGPACAQAAAAASQAADTRLQTHQRPHSKHVIKANLEGYSLTGSRGTAGIMIEMKFLQSVRSTIATKQGARPIVTAAGTGGAPADAIEAAFQAAAAANAAALRVSLCTITSRTAWMSFWTNLHIHTLPKHICILHRLAGQLLPISSCLHQRHGVCRLPQRFIIALLQGEVPSTAKQSTLTAATAAKQGSAGAGAAELALSPAKSTPRGKENVTPDRDEVTTLLGDSECQCT